jgi:hypothetical protein
MKFIVGLDSDGWPTAIPLDRIRELRIDPNDKAAVIEFRDDPNISYTLTTAFICDASDVTNYMMLVITKRGKR